jgi:hypothetical protein
MNNGSYELCEAEIYLHGYHVYIKVKGQWRLYRVCEACHVVYQHVEDQE